MLGPAEVEVRVLSEKDIAEADRIVRLAFGTFLGVADPLSFFGDRNMIENRWRANPANVIGAYSEGKLVGSNVVTMWGKFGFFGPLSVLPELWDKGIAKRLLEPTMELFSKWNTTHEGLFTFAQSPKHVGLYQKFGFNARFLTAIMSKKVEGKVSYPEITNYLFSSLRNSERDRNLNGCRELTNEIFDGLDLTQEIIAVHDLKLGDTILVGENPKVTAFAVCHVGANTEAGSGCCYIKFGASRSKESFRALLRACDKFASEKGLKNIEAGVNLGRSEAYREMLSHGFRTDFQGVAMQRPNEEGFNRPDVFAIDDWR